VKTRVQKILRARKAAILPVGAQVGRPAPDPVQEPPPHPVHRVLPHHLAAVPAIAFGANERLIAVGGGNAVLLWDFTDMTSPTRTATLTWDTGVTVVSVAISPEGHLLATASDDENVTLWHLGDPADPARIATLHVPRHRWNHQGCAIDFSPDGRTLVTADRAALLWDVTDPARPILTATLPLLPRWLGVAGCAAAFSGDGRLLATASRTAVSVWDITDPAHPDRLATLRPQGRGTFGTSTVTIHAVDFSPDGRLLATAGIVRIEYVGDTGGFSLSSSAVVLWDVTDPTHPTRTATLAERDSRPARPRARPFVPTFIGHQGTVWSARFSPNAPLLATAGDDGVLVWDVADPTRPHLIAALPENRSALSVAFSPDGRLLATGSSNCGVAVWRTPQG
jgi:WD40 repeat protein